MASTTRPVDGTESACRTAGPDPSAGGAAEPATRLGLLPCRGHGDVLADREQVLAAAAGVHGPTAGAPGAETVTWHP